MKHLLLTYFLAASTVGMYAAAPEPSTLSIKTAENIPAITVKSSQTTAAKRLADGVTITTEGGVKRLRSLHVSDTKARTNKIATKSPRKAAAATPDGYALYESFEGWDGENAEWTPEGWTVDMRGEVARAESWGPSKSVMFMPGPTDGDVYYCISFATDKQDEWLISPYADVEEGMILTFDAYIEPLFLFNLDNLDWDTYEFIGDKVTAATLQVWAQQEGGEWQMLHDFVDDYKDMSGFEMLLNSPNDLEKKSISLDEFSGKKTRIGFRYVGTDGNIMMIDAVGIGYPSLGDISYFDPFSTLYWGYDTDFQYLNGAIAHYPVYAPLLWQNLSYIEGATFSWEYCDPITAEFVTCDNPDMLEVTYVPDYNSAASMKNNFFYPPVLNATAPKATPGSYSAPYIYFQAGGKAERTLNDGNEFTPSLLPYNLQNVGTAYYVVDDASIGDLALPVFGHNVNSDRYWLNYSLNGSEEQPGDYVRLEGIANLFYPTEAPLVVRGITVFGYGKIENDAEFTATIYGINSEYSKDITTMEVIARTSIKGSQAIAVDPASKSELILPFEFETPAVVKATEEHPAYFIVFEGFNSDKVSYFAPYQSKANDPNGLCLGYLLKHIDLSNHTKRPEYYSFTAMSYIENGEYVDLSGSFAIGIDGEYPWLTTDCERIDLNTGTHFEVELGSYYDGTELTVEAPTGVTATVAGRYNKCILTVDRTVATVVVDGDIVVKGPGVEVRIPVVGEASGIGSIVSPDATVEGIYDLSGRRLMSTDKGVYIIKYTDGSVRKTVIK